MSTLALATVTANAEPCISGVDGHFLHGEWHFGTARSAVKAHHLAARPAASASHMPGEELGVFTHGTVETMKPAEGGPDPGWTELRAYLQDHYGDHDFDWDNEVVYYRLRPRWMTVYRGDPDELAQRAEVNSPSADVTGLRTGIPGAAGDPVREGECSAATKSEPARSCAARRSRT